MINRKQEETWVKQGDFKICRKYDSSIPRYVEYRNKQLHAEIRIQGEKEQFKHGTEITKLCVVIFSKMKDNTLTPLYDASFKANFPVTYNKNCSNSIIFTLPIEEKQELTPIFRTIGKYLPIKSIKKEILDALDLKAIPDEKEFYDNLDILIKNNNIQEAIQQALIIEEDEEVLWNLIALLEKNEKFMEALEVCQLIPKENCNYCKANEKAEQIIIVYIQNNPSLSQEEINYYLEARIRFMLRSNNPTNQTVLDQHFNEFCGDISLNPINSAIKKDENTIINLGKNISVLNKKILELQKQNRELLTRLEKITAEKETLQKEIKNSRMKAAITIQFWYRRTRDENKALSMIEHKENSFLVNSIINRRG